MPLHRNESSSQKTLNFKGEETFVKENHMLSRERESQCLLKSVPIQSSIHRNLFSRVKGHARRSTLKRISNSNGFPVDRTG